MPGWHSFRNHLSSLLWKVSVKEEVNSELDFHIEMSVREFMARGMAPEEAREQALRRFGDVTETKRQCKRLARSRDRRTGLIDWFGELRQDLSFSLRQMSRSRLWTLLVILSLAIGISANAIVFSIVNAVVLRPLPYPEPDRIVRMREVTPEGGMFSISEPNLLDFKDRSRSFESLGAFAFPRPQLTLLGDGEPEELLGMRCTPELFTVFGVAPAIGRTFLAEEGKPGNPDRVAVLSHGLWVRRFGADASVVGRELNINGESWSVVGVMPERFRPPIPADVWIPQVLDPRAERSDHRMEPFGRLKDGVTEEQLQADIRAVAAQLSDEYPQSNGGWSAVAYPVADSMIGSQARQTTIVLQIAVILMLLLACANVSNLLIARATAREREISIRAAVGAGRSRILRQLLTESAFLSVIGAAAGISAAYWALPAIVAWNPDALPRLDEISLDGNVLIFSIAISAAAGLLAGIAPALHATRGNLNNALKGERHSSGGGVRRLRDALVVGELALAMILLTGAGLLLNSLNRMRDVDPGFIAENVLLAPVNLPANQYPEMAPQTAAFYRQLLDNVRAIPGVVSAGASIVNPYAGFRPAAKIGGVEAVHPDDFSPAQWRSVTPEYFEAAGITLLGGRFFTHADRPAADAEGVDRFARAPAIVSDRLAAQLFPNIDPIGETIKWFTADDPLELTIVGVVRGVRDVSLVDEPLPMVFIPHEYLSWPEMTLVIKTEGNPAAFTPAVREAVRTVDKNLPAPAVVPMQSRLERATAGSRFNSQLLGLFALIAAVMATLGIYGVLSYAVERRTREIGIRLALGAPSSGMVKLILRHAAVLTGMGLVAGLAGAFGFARLMDSLLYEASSHGAGTYALVTVLLSAVSLFAGYVPAWRASRIDPALTLRQE